MASNIAELEAQALRLSREDRAQLADKLLSSLSADRAIDDAWAVEVDRRIAEFEDGSAPDVPLGEALARARAAIR